MAGFDATLGQTGKPARRGDSLTPHRAASSM